ncbi:hypothetical protein [Streptomyces sp. NPDC017991]|uniref:hypothetical protein n=1 Tax=Streptomyces sp. NPDC017991 TaxID=3365026 RepID=UPI0037A426C8
MPERTHTLHPAERPRRDAARRHGAYPLPTHGHSFEQEGFTHGATHAQLPSAAAILYGSYEGPDEQVTLGVGLDALVQETKLWR